MWHSMGLKNAGPSTSPLARNASGYAQDDRPFICRQHARDDNVDTA
jgi:hypothetical protein